MWTEVILPIGIYWIAVLTYKTLKYRNVYNKLMALAEECDIQVTARRDKDKGYLISKYNISTKCVLLGYKYIPWTDTTVNVLAHELGHAFTCNDDNRWRYQDPLHNEALAWEYGQNFLKAYNMECNHDFKNDCLSTYLGVTGPRWVKRS